MKTYFQFRQELNEKRNFASVLATAALAGGIAGGALRAAENAAEEEPEGTRQVEQIPVQATQQQVSQQAVPKVKQKSQDKIDLPGITSKIQKYESAGADYKKISRPFNDHKGKLTIGHGHLIGDHSEGVFKKAFPEEHKRDPNFGKNALSGKKALTSDQMTKLMQHDISIRIPQIAKMIPEFHNMPTYLQHELASEHYRGGLGHAKKTVEHINAGRFHEAAHEYLDSDEYRDAVRDQTGVATRYDNLHKALLRYHKERQGTR